MMRGHRRSEKGLKAKVVRRRSSITRSSHLRVRLTERALSLSNEFLRAARVQVVRRTTADRPGLVPILGARTRARLDDNLGALALTLNDAQAARLDTASAVPPGFPHEFLSGERCRAMVTGGT